MISVVIPALNAEARIAACLDALVAPAMAGAVKEVIVVDGGSSDRTRDIADGFGARVLTAPPGRGGQLSAGAQAARGDWFLFLHADTALQEGWAAEATVHIEAHAESAAVFTLAFDSKKGAAKFVSTGAMIRTRVLRLPYGDQGLLISRAFYDAVGGFADMPLFEDVDMARRIVKARGRRALRVLDTTATTSAERYERLGYARCILRNAWLLTRFHLGAAPEALAKAYR